MIFNVISRNNVKQFLVNIFLCNRFFKIFILFLLNSIINKIFQSIVHIFHSQWILIYLTNDKSKLLLEMWYPDKVYCYRKLLAINNKNVLYLCQNNIFYDSLLYISILSKFINYKNRNSILNRIRFNKSPCTHGWRYPF